VKIYAGNSAQYELTKSSLPARTTSGAQTRLSPWLRCARLPFILPKPSRAAARTAASQLPRWPQARDGVLRPSC